MATQLADDRRYSGAITFAGPVAFEDDVDGVATTAYVDAADASAVQKSAVHVFGPFQMITSATSSTAMRWCPGFAGTITRIRSTAHGGTLDGDATFAVSVDGGACTGGAVTHPSGASTDTRTSAISAGGAFTAAQILQVAGSGPNTVYAYAGVTIEYTRT